MSDIVYGGDAISISFIDGSGVIINRHYIVNIIQLCGINSTISIETPGQSWNLKVTDCMNVYEQLRKCMHNM